MDENHTRTITTNIEVPRHMIDSDGNLTPEFYDKLFNMLGKDYAGVKVESIEVVGEPKEVDKA